MGDNAELHDVCPSFFTCGTPYGDLRAIHDFNAPLRTGSIDAARAALAREQERVAAAAAQVDAVDMRVGGALDVRQLWESLRPRVTHPSVEPGLLVGEVQRQMRSLKRQVNAAIRHRELTEALRVRGYRFYFFSREESRPHVHVQHATGEAKIWLKPRVGVAQNYGLSARRLAAAGLRTLEGRRVRIVTDLGSSPAVDELPGDGAQVSMTFTFEIEDSEKPAAVAEIIFRYYE